MSYGLWAAGSKPWFGGVRGDNGDDLVRFVTLSEAKGA